MKAARRLVDGDFVVNDVSRHARMRCKERGLPLESLSGHAPGVRTVLAPSGKVVTVMSKVVKPVCLRGIENPVLFRDQTHFGTASPDPAFARVDATGLVPYVVGNGGEKIERVCQKHGVSVTVDCNTLRIEGAAAAAAAAEFEGIIDKKRRALRWEGADVIEVDVTGYVGRVIGLNGLRISKLERTFNVYIKIDGAKARILPAMNSAADADGARAAIEALNPRPM